MFFYVFLQPEVFEEARTDGEDAARNLLEILKGFCQNCFLAIFEDYHWMIAVKEILLQRSWPEPMIGSLITKILVHLEKQKRFLYCITPDYSGAKADLDCVFEQANSAMLDLILVIRSEASRHEPEGVALATRRAYPDTAFASKRSNLAFEGKTCNAGEMGEVEFLNFHFAKALRNAAEIHLYDRICGRSNLRDNYGHTIKRLMGWLGSILADPVNCKIVFHLGQPKGKGKDHVLRKLASFRTRALSRTTIKVYFYAESPKVPDLESPKVPGLPHQRFIVTDQIALNVERGLDFLDEDAKSCRDTYVNYQNPEEAWRLLRGRSYEPETVPGDLIQKLQG